MGMPDEVAAEAAPAAESAAEADAAVSAPAPAPVTVTVAADKVSYAVGEPIQVTVSYEVAGKTEQLTLTAKVTDPAGQSGEGTATVTVELPSEQAATVAVTDSAGASYTQLSASPGTAVFGSTVAAHPAA